MSTQWTEPELEAIDWPDMLLANLEDEKAFSGLLEED